MVRVEVLLLLQLGCVVELNIGRTLFIVFTRRWSAVSLLRCLAIRDFPLSVIGSNDLVVIDLIVLYLIQRPDNFKFFNEGLIFGNCRHCRGMMLLVAHYHMAYKRALTWEESSTCLKCHSMPHLTVGLYILLIRIRDFSVNIFSRFHCRFLCTLCTQEPELSANTEVGDWEKDDFLKHCISAKLMAVVNM